MDFARINLATDAERGATLRLYNPYTFDPDYPDLVDYLKNGDEYIEIDLVGLDGETGRRASAKMVKETNHRRGRSASVRDYTEEELLELAAESQDIQSRYYAQLVTGWRNITYLPDSEIDDPDAVPRELPFSQENAAMLFRTRPWIRDQVDRFLSRRSNFRRD